MQSNIVQGIKDIINEFELSAEMKKQSSNHEAINENCSFKNMGSYEFITVMQIKYIYQDCLALNILNPDSNECREFYKLINRYIHKLYQNTDLPQSLCSIRMAKHVLSYLKEYYSKKTANEALED